MFWEYGWSVRRRLWGEEVLILDLGTRWGWVVIVTPPPPFSLWERTPGTHCTGGWVGPRAGLDTEARGKILSPLPGIETRSSGRPPQSSQTPCWLSYRAHQHCIIPAVNDHTYRCVDCRVNKLVCRFDLWQNRVRHWTQHCCCSWLEMPVIVMSGRPFLPGSRQRQTRGRIPGNKAERRVSTVLATRNSGSFRVIQTRRYCLHLYCCSGLGTGCMLRQLGSMCREAKLSPTEEKADLKVRALVCCHCVMSTDLFSLSTSSRIFMKLVMKVMSVETMSLSCFMSYHRRQEPGSSVSIVSGYGLDDRAIEVRSPAEARGFSSSLCVQTGSGAHPASSTMGNGGKARPGRDADRSPPSCAEVVNE
jgi:hypothetical protein